MKKWSVQRADGLSLKLYYRTLEEAHESNPNSVISEDCDISHEEYIKKIKLMSIEELLDRRGRTVLKIPHNAGYIYVKLYYDKADDTYYDYLEYQRHDTAQFVNPIGFIASTPYELYMKFMQNLEKDANAYSLSNREIKKLKAKRFYNKNNKAYWIDNDGYIYWADKNFLPSKKDLEEWKRFNGNKNAIQVNYTVPLKYTSIVRWFDSIDDFKSTFQEIIDETPSSYATPTYSIEKVGYTYIHPEDRKCIFRLPFFDIQKEFSLADSGNSNAIKNQIARTWAKMLEGVEFYGEWLNNVELLEDIIDRYLEYTLKVD